MADNADKPQNQQGQSGQAKQQSGKRDQHGEPVPPFVVEFDDGHNRQMSIGTLGLVVRGRWSNANVRIGGENKMGGMRDVPGLCLRVSPRECTVDFIDPLADNQELRRNIQFHRANAMLASDDAGVAPSRMHGETKELTVHHMKTLLIELQGRLAANEIKVVEGRFPSKQQIDALPGDELMDPQSLSPGEPMFKKDYWKHKRRQLVPLSGEPIEA